MGRYAIVLGAGGVSAWALHFGAAAALAEAGLPLADAHRVVGTSAGAAVAAAVLGGVSTEQALAEVLRPPPAEERRAYLAEVRDHNRRRSWWPAQPGLARHLVGDGGIGVAWAGIAPAGIFPSDSLLRFPGLAAHDGWPTNLRVVAVRLSDGERVVFGRDRRDVAVPTAVRASQSVPLLFAPTPIGGDRFVDGAVRSSTHADLLLDSGCDLAVVVAPMCRRGGGASRAVARSRARDELLALREAGIPTVAIRPGPDLEDLLGSYRSDPDAPAALVAAGRRLVTRALRTAPWPRP